MEKQHQQSENVSSPGITRDVLDPGNLMLLVYLVIIALIILFGSLLPAGAAEPGGEREAEFSLDSVRQGELLLPEGESGVVQALLLKQDVNISVSGIVSRVRVAQQFRNVGEDWVEGVYVFPLPDESAVDRLRMVVGEREIVGVIKEREEAKAIYDQARAEGRKSSLLAQNRPNIFTTRIANIGPGEIVEVVIEYQQQVRYQGGIFSLRFPMAITPRYIPGRPVVTETSEPLRFSAGGWAEDTDRVPDASAITPPVADPAREEGPAVSLAVDFLSGFQVKRLESLYHVMNVVQQDEGGYLLDFTGEVRADRDFVLEWEPAENGQAAAALLGEESGDDRYLLLMLMPPHEKFTGEVPREAIFILDISGSMAGPSIVQAKAALREALTRLKAVDRFNVISFNDTARAFFADSVPATPMNVMDALEQLEMLQANGGTEMRAALELALDPARKSDRIRQVVFLTDGAVGNEQELFALISHRLGDSRLFTVGIGSAPNSYFMTRAATIGRGSHTAIGDTGEVRMRVDALLTRLESPALTDIRLSDEHGAPLAGEIYPSPLPDLYFGEPLMVAIKAEEAGRTIVVAGTRAAIPWQVKVDTTGFGSRPGISSLWARKKIRSAMESLVVGADEEQVREIVVETALAHQLVSRYTSLVAVDDRVSRPGDAPMSAKMVKNVPPRGLQLDKVFGGGARTATPASLLMVTGSLALLLAWLLQLAKRRW